MTDPHPVVLTFPFLELTRPIEFGPWWLGPLSQFKGPWLSPEYEAAARRFLGSFRRASDSPITKPTLLARRERGVDGQAPTLEERQAIQLAVGFGVIDQNPYWDPENEYSVWSIGTADNADFWVQPLHPDGQITVGAGSRVELMSGGLNLNDEDFNVPAPLELHMASGIILDQELIEAMYSVLAQPPTGCEDTAARIGVATRWLLRSWQNTPSITNEDRLIFVKIATEAITREDKSAKSAAHLEALFVSAADQEGEGIGADDLLWQPEQPTFLRVWPSGSAQVSALVHWGGAFGDARNDLVHGKDGTSLTYHQDNSPYNGPFVEIGDRLVREAISVLLGQCGYPAVWRRGIARASFHVYQDLTKPSGEDSEPSG